MKLQYALLISISMAIGVVLSWYALSYFSAARKVEIPFKKCMNIRNALESPKGVTWNGRIENHYFDVIKAAGFDSVRIPVRFSDYAINNPNYQLEEEFVAKIDHYINYALEAGLTVILDLHHFTELMEEPYEYRECFIAIWEQLSLRYRDYPPELIFELLNEPQKNLKGDLWNEILTEAVFTIRRYNPTRYIIIGPDRYNSLNRLEKLNLPDNNNIIVSIHYYNPADFTFQGDPYHKGYENLSDIPWGSPEDIRKLEADFLKASDWAKANNRMIFVGEFGVNQNAPAQYRELWIKTVRKEAEKKGFAWGYYEFCANFGIYNPETDMWDEKLLEALID